MSTHSTLNDITISDILRLALPVKTAVLAAPSDARRIIRWVALISTWNDLASQVKPGDLILVPPLLQKQISDQSLQPKLSELIDLDVVGLIFFEPVSDTISEAVSNLSLTLLATPKGTLPREVHRDIVTLLVDRQFATAERGMQLYRKLAEMSREEQGLDAMTDLLSKLTGKIVVIQDKRLEIRASSAPRNNDIDLTTLFELLKQREQLPSVLRNRKAAARARPTYWQQILPIENVGRLVSPIISGDRARGYLSLIGPADKLDMLDSLAVEHGAAACALEMAKAKAVSEAKKELRGNFLEGLLAGTLPKKEIERLEGRLDHNTEQLHIVITAAWAGKNTPSLRRLETAVSWLLQNHRRSALVHIYGDQHLCIFQALKNETDIESAHDLARRLQDHVKKEFPTANLIAGMSGPAQILSEWPTIYAEALQAMQLGERLQLHEVVEFNSLGVYRLLGQLEDAPTVRQFTKQVIGPLADYDRQHRSTLVQTIDSYFMHHGNISQTAEALFIHRNTLLYRLDRIQELTQHDLNQSNMRLALHLALKFWQLSPEK
jgi:PucR family transcriptional regulator, purine catabolism regulatory protein